MFWLEREKRMESCGPYHMTCLGKASTYNDIKGEGFVPIEVLVSLFLVCLVVLITCAVAAHDWTEVTNQFTVAKNNLAVAL